jgi:hypothetical protein
VWLALVYAAVVLVRFAWFFLTPYFHPVFDRLLRNPPGRSRCPATPGRGAVLTHAPVPSGAGPCGLFAWAGGHLGKGGPWSIRRPGGRGAWRHTSSNTA